MFNKVLLIGNLGRDPESNEAGTVTRISVATSRRVERDGNWQDETEWHRVVCFGKTAENVQKFLTKGSRVHVDGRLQTREYQAKDGTTKKTTEVVANYVLFLGGKDESTNTDDLPF